MRLKFGQLTLIPLGILLSLPSCGKKSETNEGFLPKLSEITADDVLTDEQLAGNSLWSAVVAALEVPEIDVTSSASVVTSLGVVSTLITDSTKATEQAALKVGAVVGSIAEQKCNATATTGPFLTDLTSTIAAGVLSSTGVTIGSGGFKIDSTTGLPANLAGQTTLTTKVYLMAYKINADADFRFAFLSVPQTAAPASPLQAAVKTDTTGGAYGYPLALYAHAATSGLSYGEIAKVAGDLQLGHIILAPAFPGEKICVSPAASGACSDDIGKTSVGTSKPYTNDVTDLLGAYECVRTKLTTYAATGGTSGSFTTLSATTGEANGTVAIANYAKISYEMAIASGTYTTALSGAALQPVTYGIGLGRGANVIRLAQQRAGAVNSILSSTATDATTTAAKTALSGAGIVAPETFNCALTAGGNTTYAHGQNKIYLNYWVTGSSTFISEDKQTALDGIPGFAYIHSTIAAIRDDANKDEATKATEIAAYVKSIDSSFQMGLLHGSTANWGKLYRAKYLAAAAEATSSASLGATAKATLGKAQGSALVINGTKDVVAHLSNALVDTGVGAGVTAAIATEKAKTSSTSSLAALGGVNWLGMGILEDGTDNGHVTDKSFLAGKSIASATSKMTTNITETNYLDLTPPALITKWMTDECQGKSINADLVTP